MIHTLKAKFTELKSHSLSADSLIDKLCGILQVTSRDQLVIEFERLVQEAERRQRLIIKLEDENF